MGTSPGEGGRRAHRCPHFPEAASLEQGGDLRDGGDGLQLLLRGGGTMAVKMMKGGGAPTACCARSRGGKLTNDSGIRYVQSR